MTYITLKDNSKYYFDKTKVMGIVNVTPDSFYSGSRNESINAAVNKALKMIEDGADILDIGGESTRPGSDPVTLQEEINRVVPVIESIRKSNTNILISVDTYRAKTAEAAIKAGADIINDISAMMFDEDMHRVIKNYNVPIILMHTKGTPKNMQMNPHYDDVIGELISYFRERIEFSRKMGISIDKLIIDPGVGFAKLYEHNIELIKKIGIFHELELPILLAVSRKTSIGMALGNLPPEERLEGTLAVSCYAAMQNIEMVRVHDVLENKRALTMMEVLK
ncbi:MAG: folP [Clostridiales bacterium]|jgi:dihydropteroate synthase|nr:folP [Clostridiales bacterium]